MHFGRHNPYPVLTKKKKAMKTLKLGCTIIAIFILASCGRDPDAPRPRGNSNPPNGSTDVINLGDCGGTASTDLIAGQHSTIGRVTAKTDGNYLSVIYEITEPNWGITETHLSVKSAWEEIPQTPTGNPIPGQFEFKNDHGMIIGYRYDSIDVSAWDTVSIAAHCKVKLLNGVNPNPIPNLMPGQVYNMDVDIYSASSQTTTNFPYYLSQTLSNSSQGTGTYDAFCIDKGGFLSRFSTYQVVAIDPFVAELSNLFCLGIDQTQNVDKIAYIINRYYVANAYPGAQAEEIQMAIWILLEPSGAIIQTNEFSANTSIVNTILADAENGKGFIPGLCDYRIMVEDPKCHPILANNYNQDSIQSTITIIPSQECTVIGEETAWAFGPQFPGANWGMYFNYCVK